MRNKFFAAMAVVLLAGFLFSGCAAFHSDLHNKFAGNPKKNLQANRVNVLFIFSHYQMTRGLDAIPKLQSGYPVVHGFDDFFRDALNEFTNIKSFATFTENSSDVNEPARRKLRDSLMEKNDFTIKIRIQKEKSFAKYFFGIAVNSLSAIVFPIRYKDNYFVNVDIYDKNQRLLKTFTRDFSVSKWVETLMVFFYPFYPQQKVIEKEYVEFMHDIFREIESDGVLNK